MLIGCVVGDVVAKFRLQALNPEYRLQPNSCKSNRTVNADGSTATKGVNTNVDQLTLKQMRPVFVIVGVFTGMAICAFIIEQFHAFSSQNNAKVEKGRQQHQKIINKKSLLSTSVKSGDVVLNKVSGKSTVWVDSKESDSKESKTQPKKEATDAFGF